MKTAILFILLLIVASVTSVATLMGYFPMVFIGLLAALWILKKITNEADKNYNQRR